MTNTDLINNWSLQIIIVVSFLASGLIYGLFLILEIILNRLPFTFKIPGSLKILAAMLPVFLLLFSPVLLQGSAEQLAATEFFAFLTSEADTWFWWPILLIFIIFQLYIWYGPNDSLFYEQVFISRKSVWTTFSLVIFGLILFVWHMVLTTNQRVAALEPLVVPLNTAINLTNELAGELDDDFEEIYDGKTGSQISSDLRKNYYQLNDSNGNVKFISEIFLNNKNCSIDAQRVKCEENKSEEGITPEEEQNNAVALLQQVSALKNIFVISVGIDENINDLGVLINEWEKCITSDQLGINCSEEPETCPEGDQEVVECNKVEFNRLFKEIGIKTEEIKSLSQTMQREVTLLTVDGLIPMLLVIILFVVFLLIPWLLYLSFIIGKQASTIRDRRNAIQSMKLTDRLLRSSADITDQRQEIARNVANLLSHALAAFKLENEEKGRIWIEKALRATKTDLGEIDNKAHHEQRSQIQFNKLRTDERKFSIYKYPDLKILRNKIQDAKESAPKKGLNDENNPEGNHSVLKELLESARDEALEIVIRQRRFHNREYIIPLIILTLLSVVGWFYVIFPDMLPGLSALILKGGDLQNFTKGLTVHFTTVTMSFSGGWLFTNVMLVYRWTQNDLYPKSFLYASMRLAFGLLIGLLFSSWFSVGGGSVQGVAAGADAAGNAFFDSQTFSTFILILAFVVGAAPIEAIRAVFRIFNKNVGGVFSAVLNRFQLSILSEFRTADWGAETPLTALKDITIWEDTRLLLEGITSVHSMATVDLERLLFNTPYDAQQLVDWVDQALLIIHIGQEWRPGLEAIGIRKATNLYEIVCDANGELDKDGLSRLRNAYNHAQVAGLGAESALYQTQNAAAVLETSAAEMADRFEKARAAAEELDVIAAVQTKMTAVAALLNEQNKTTAEIARHQVVQALKSEKLGEEWANEHDLATNLERVTAEILIAKAIIDVDKVSRAILKGSDATADNARETVRKSISSTRAAVELLPAVKQHAESARDGLLLAMGKIPLIIAEKELIKALQALNILLEQTHEAGNMESLEEISSAFSAEPVGQLIQFIEAAITNLPEDNAGELENAVNSLTSMQEILDEIDKVIEDLTIIEEIETAKSSLLQIESAAKNAKIQAQNACEAIRDHQLFTSWQASSSMADEMVTGISAMESGLMGVKSLLDDIHMDAPETWDNVDELKQSLGEIDGLKARLNEVEKKRSELLKRLNNMKVTYSVAQAKRRVKRLGDERMAAEKILDASLKVLEPDNLGRLDVIQVKATEAIEALTFLEEQTRKTAEKAIQAAVPPQLTNDIIEVMLRTLKNEPNVSYVRDYWRNTADLYQP